MLLNYMKIANLLILGLQNCENVGRVAVYVRRIQILQISLSAVCLSVCVTRCHLIRVQVARTSKSSLHRSSENLADPGVSASLAD